MSEAAAKLLATFESLDPQEQHELLAELLRRTGELSDAFLADDQLARLADDLFQALDVEESDGAKPNAG